jgi:hypothetical protein
MAQALLWMIAVSPALLLKMAIAFSSESLPEPKRLEQPARQREK